jgi:hypothetical protein
MAVRRIDMSASVRAYVERGLVEDDLLHTTRRGDLPGMRAAKARGARKFDRCFDMPLSGTHVRRTIGKHLLRRWDALNHIFDAETYFRYGVTRNCFGLRERMEIRRSGQSGWRQAAGITWIYTLSPNQKLELLTEYHRWRRDALMQDAHERLVDIAIALEPLKLPIYVLLWILEWVWSSEGVSGSIRPDVDRSVNADLRELRRVRLLEGVRTSALKIR